MPKPRTSVRHAEYFHNPLLTSYHLRERATKNILSESQSVVDECNKALDELMQKFRDRTVRDTHVNVHRVLDILEDLNLDSMAYTDGAGLDTRKKCMDGTRVEIVKEIVDWINDPDVHVPRIFWLHGQAGRGKSAIAHTVALQYKNVRGVYSSLLCKSQMYTLLSSLLQTIHFLPVTLKQVAINISRCGGPMYVLRQREVW